MTEQESAELAQYASWQAPETSAQEEAPPSRFTVMLEKIDGTRDTLMANMREKLQQDADQDPAKAFAKEQVKDESMELIEQSLSSFKDLFSSVRIEQKSDPVLTNAVHDGGSMSGSALVLGLVASRLAKGVGRFISR